MTQGKEITLHEKHVAIQMELKVPKNQRNKFGKYNYRSCEDINESAKPLCHKHGLSLNETDEIVLVGDRYYIKAQAFISDGSESIGAFGYAREELTKKGMDGSQITGASSSYARKYALNGLFGIDDSKDSDNTNTHSKDETKPVDVLPEKITTTLQAIDKVDALIAYCGEAKKKLSGGQVQLLTKLFLAKRAELEKQNAES